MFGSLSLPAKSIADYGAVPGVDVGALRALAEPLQGVRVLNLSLTSFGTTVADLLSSAVPLLHDLGLDAQWQVVRPYEDPAVETALYSAIGGGHPWTEDLEGGGGAITPSTPNSMKASGTT